MRGTIREEITVKTFPGATVHNIPHYVQPIVEKYPKHVELHVGTNDIQAKEAEESVAEMERLGNIELPYTLTWKFSMWVYLPTDFEMHLRSLYILLSKSGKLHEENVKCFCHRCSFYLLYESMDRWIDE